MAEHTETAAARRPTLAARVIMAAVPALSEEDADRVAVALRAAGWKPPTDPGAMTDTGSADQPYRVVDLGPDRGLLVEQGNNKVSLTWDAAMDLAWGLIDIRSKRDDA